MRRRFYFNSKYVGYYSQAFIPVCASCHQGVEIEVTSDMINGGPVTSIKSQKDADEKSKETC